MRPNHHQFTAFAYVVREGSFSAAAERLGVSQSAVTQQVAKLERNVGAQLLIRGRDGVQVTPTGQDLYTLADRLVALDSAIAEQLEGFASMKDGRIKIIANAPQPTLKIIARFTERFPGIHVDFGLHDWTTATGMIRKRLADVGLITDPPRSEDFVHHRLQTTRYVAYCRQDHPLAGRSRLRLADLQDETIILPEEGSLTQRVVKATLRKRSLPMPRTVTMTTFPVMCEAVLQGIGIALFLRDSSLIDEGMVEIEVEEFDTLHEIWLVATKDRARLRLVSEFVATATSTVF
ncbi:transcriptional regulator, LysR family protein [Pseudooceanicola batsensis HTCC2597]|uniref:Transcriptional regulator, LysR family protein n=1 Tax=Pseudooceanicola batsensis (strain ATCC BAA-863 / DSM 15984 / KCTC 12145 / HTCC2597) TaxID=252305 RepID=A3TY90_PSEBH|nr:LysR family transcriptional regulator [Pseudooceanicola batsensis]EAQ03124.1 transcriptional regulator, LysR family protein [Pseudooceanicola batsensis HTCC2597]